MSRFVLTAQLQLQAPNNVAQVVRQIQSQLNNVNVNVNVQNAARAQRQLQQVTAQTQAATSAADRMGRAFAISIRRFAAFSIATRAVGLFTSTLSDAIQTAIDFEREMIKVSQVTGDSLEKLKGLSKTITGLSTGLGVASNSLLEASTLLLQAGISAKDTEVALKTLAKAALAPNFDSLSETTEGAIAILAQFGEGVGALEKQLGSINAVAGAFAVEASDLMDVIRRTGGVFKSSGGSLNELIALFTSVRATTRESAESIGTGLRTIFTRIQRPKTIEFLKQFGVELVDMEGKFVGPYEAVKRLSSALAGLGERDITFIRIAEELGGFRQIGKVLPLLQQFTTAQNALNVANKAGNSLTTDAATAQQALAIRILKVKEEFLALVRGMTETKTFQIMANTALSLASALIKMADAIKPLLPMLTALMAFRMARGFGSFLGGIGRGMSSGRTFSTGGKVHHFARGGFVPGVGNRDTVPAMLQPGEFVIKKSSVNSIGAGNLAAMNENRFKDGGAMTTAEKLAAARAQSITQNPNRAKTKSYNDGQQSAVRFSVADGNIGAFFMNPEGGADGSKSFKQQSFDITNSKILSLPGISPKEVRLKDKQGRALPRMPGEKQKFTAKGILEAGNISTFYPSFTDVSKGSLSSIIESNVKQKLSEAVVDTANFISGNKLLDIPPIDANDALMRQTAAQRIQADTGAIKTTAGYLFEGVVDAITGARPASSNAVFDFPASSLQGNRQRLGALFGNIAGINSLKQADAKASYSSKIIDGGPGSGSISSKIVNSINNGVLAGIKVKTQKKHFGGIISKFATGGGVGTDTVPALLTPGEFVVNRSSAQRIGYGNLNRMNKVGRYARGGIVQHFAGGSTGTGAKPLKGDFAVQRTVDMSGLTGATLKAMAALDKFTIGGLGKGMVVLEALFAKIKGSETVMQQYSRNIIYLNSVIPNFSKIVQENQRVTKRSVFTQTEMVYSMAENIRNLQESGASQAQVRKAAQGYANMLQHQTGMLQKGASVKQLSGTTPSFTGLTNQQMLNTTPAQRLAAKKAAQSGGGSAGSSAIGRAVGVVQDNKMMAAAIATSLVQGFLPAIDENSSALLKLTHGFLGLVTTISSVGFALEMFGVKLSKGAIMDFLGGKGLGVGGMKKVMGGLESAGLSPASAKSITGVVNGLSKLAGPIVAVAASAYLATKAFETVIEAVYNFEGRLKSAVESGDIEKAKSVANERATFQGANVVRGGGATAGAVIGLILGGPVGAAIGAGLGAAAGTVVAKLLPESVLDWFNESFGGNTRASAVALAAAQAGAVKTQKELDKAQKTATNAMEDFEKGTISASDALDNIRSATSSVQNQEKRSSEFAMANLENRGGTFRDVMTLGGLLGESSSVRNQRLGKESADQIRQSAKFQAEAFQMESPARSAMIRSGLARGKNKEEIKQQAVGDLQERRRKLLLSAGKADVTGDEESAKAFREAAAQMEDQIAQVNREMENLAKEVERAKAAFDAMNLGLRGASATSTAMSASMNKFAAGLEVGGNTFVANTDFLSQAMTSAAQSMNPAEIKSAVKDVSQNLSQMGVSGTAIKKFEANTNGFIQAQQNYNKAFENVRANIKSRQERGLGGGDTPDEIKKAFATELTAGLGDEAKKNLTAIIENIPLSQEEVDKIIQGDMSVFGDKLSEAGQKQFEEIMKIAQERQKAEQVLISLTKQRIDAERKFVEAQKEAVDLTMEGRDIQAKYGGRPVTTGEKRAAIVAKANAGAAGAGLGAMRTGSIAELRNRNTQIMMGFGRIEERRSKEGGMAGVGGVEKDATQQNLQQAQKDQVQTIRDLIKLEEEELKIIQEKNKMEKDSLEALISGDVEKFFEGQAAMGAQAAIAAGDTNMANMFGAKAIGDAFKDIQRQQEAGVQTMFGRQLGGPGGLAEQAAGSALAARGVMDPRMAQKLAGTTAAEEESKARLRDLGGMLGETGAIGAAMAAMEVQTAEINVANAQVKLSEIEGRGQQAAAGLRRGGIVYADQGMFVPRGTDTVPAMLTPGEFVVRREAVNRGNNLQLLRAINTGGVGGFARGGKVGYYNNGGMVQYKAFGDLISGLGKSMGIDPKMISNLGNIFTSFVSGFNESIKNLQNTKLQIKLDTTNVNVNLTGQSMLSQISDQSKKDIIIEVIKTLKNQYGIGNNGKLTENTSNLARPGQGT